MLNAGGRVKHWVRPGSGGAETVPGRANEAGRMRAAAIDLGKVRVGVAVADELGLLAHPRPHLDGRNRQALFAALKRLAEEEHLGVFVVGLPRSLDGTEGPPARRARKFAEELARKTGCAVELLEEWLSTREARGKLHAQGLPERAQRGRIDSAAAAVILQAWLDARAGSSA